MIENTTVTVKMTNINKRRFQHSCEEDKNSRKWVITDTTTNRIIFTGNFVDSNLICHSLNKKFCTESSEEM